MKTDATARKTRDRLFRAAIHVFAERGYQAATVREICRRAEANVASVNYYFGDKESLYGQVVATIFRSSIDARTPHLPRDAAPVDRLRTYIRSSFEDILPGTYENEGFDEQECRAMGTIFMMEVARPTKILDDIVADYIAPDCEELADIIRVFVGADASQDMVEMCAGSVISQVLHYYYSYPIIQRLTPDEGAFCGDKQFLEYAVRHVLEFSLGGLERLTGRVIDAQGELHG